MKMKKYYLGVEERSSMVGRLISKMHLLVERSIVEKSRSVLEQMLIVSPWGKFEASIEFRFENETAFKVINTADGKEMGRGTCVGPYDRPNSMVDSIVIEQTKEKATAVFSFDGPRIFVGKTYYSLESGEQTGFAVEKCLEIDKEKYDLLKGSPQDIANTWQEIQFN
jgi:hypothetical protein